MIVRQDKQRIESLNRHNEQVARQMVQQAINSVRMIDQISPVVGKGQRIVNSVRSTFVARDGTALGLAGVGMNISLLALQTAASAYQGWLEYNKQMIEYNEMMRRYGVGDLGNRANMRTSIWTNEIYGDAASKRRY